MMIHLLLWCRFQQRRRSTTPIERGLFAGIVAAVVIAGFGAATVVGVLYLD